MIYIKKKAFGTYQIAKFCQVTGPTVGRWLEDGELPFFTTAGGHRRVWIADLAAFLKAHNIPMPPELEQMDKMRILIVDDEPGIRKSLARAVGKCFPEADIHGAENGFEAGHKVASIVPSLVILDINLPGIDGYEVCRMIRNDQRTKNAGILLISGQNAQESQRRGLEAGADDFLGKPFTFDDLIEKLRRIPAGRAHEAAG